MHLDTRNGCVEFANSSADLNQTESVYRSLSTVSNEIASEKQISQTDRA